MTLSQIQKLASQGEGPFLEFKNRVPDPVKFARELIAFANTKGGMLLVGVDDDGSVLGVKDPIEERFAIDQVLDLHCSDTLDIEIKIVPVSRTRSALALHIRESKKKPVFVLDKEGAQIATVRVDDMAIDASREMRRILKHQNSDADVSFIFGEKEERLMRHLSERNQITVREFAKLVNVPNKLASHTLVLLTKAEVLQIVPRRKGGDIFILSDAID